MNSTDSITWKIKAIESETPTVYSFYLEPQGELPDFIAGQYLTIKIPNLGPAEGKAYSISSAPYEPLVRISVKRMGLFSNGIISHKVDDTITTSLPYGFFYPEPTDTADLIFAVGGIGIAPCLSIIKQLIHSKDKRNIKLFYTNQTEAEIAFKSELDNLATLNSNFEVFYYLTREDGANQNYHYGRFAPAEIISQIDNLENSEIFLCGSMNFTKDLWSGLRDAGIPQHQIYTEGFF